MDYIPQEHVYYVDNAHKDIWVLEDPTYYADVDCQAQMICHKKADQIVSFFIDSMKDNRRYCKERVVDLAIYVLMVYDHTLEESQNMIGHRWKFIEEWMPNNKEE